MFCISFQTPQIVTNNNHNTVQEIEKSIYISKFLSQYLKEIELRKEKLNQLSDTLNCNLIEIDQTSDELVNKTTLISYEVPNINSEFKTYTDYRMIGGEGTGQLEIRNNSYTDELGMRRLNGTDEYIIALGSYYSQSAGEYFIITLDTGIVLNCITGDVKDNIHTNSTSQYITMNGNIVEFHIDSKKASKEMLLSGTVSYYNEFKGNIISIQKVIIN